MAPHTPPVLLRLLLWMGAALASLVLLAVLCIALFGWNWLRGPLERLAVQKTGRVLALHGDLTLRFNWPQARLRAATVTFANPAWAREKQMVSAVGVEVAIDLPQLLQRRLAFPEVRLDQAAVFLEKSVDGRKSWLLDLGQQDENARIPIGRVALDHGTLGYDDAGQHTSLRAEVSTLPGAEAGHSVSDLRFTVQGQYKGLALQAHGRGGPVLALRDTSRPYPLTLEARVGGTGVRMDGRITGLLALSAVDMRMALRGDSLEQLYPLLGMAFPATRAYVTEGRLLRTGATWRYENFSGRVGASDIAGFAQVVMGGKRPVLTADLTSSLLALEDLGPVIGARPGSVARAVSQPPAQSRVLPDLPFHTERWDSVDADVQLRAKTIRRAKALLLDNLVAHLRLRDAVLTLEPLSFGLAGGALTARITLDGRSSPIQAHALVRARKVALARLFPTLALGKGSLGQVHGDFDLTGRGNSVGAMLAGASGKLGLVVAGGQISKLMMEKAGLHLWEILSLNLTGDRLVQLRCAVADFDVQQGKMQASALVFDTQVTTLIGTGRIDLGAETLDLTLNPKTKNTSPVALRSPIYVRGSFARPTVDVDRGRVALRAAGALTLGLINPLLALLPLIDAGPGQDSDCAQLVRDARVWPGAGKSPKKSPE